YFTGLLRNLPEVILAVIVIHAVSGLIKIKELKRIRQLNQMEFNIAIIAIAGVLVFGILKGVMISVIMSLILLIRRSSHPEVAVLGRIGNTSHFSDITRHPDNLIIPGIAIMRIESSILYFNTENIYEKINHHLNTIDRNLRVLILDLGAAPYVDVAGSKMLMNLALEFQKNGKQIRMVGALSNVREILRKQGLEEITGKISRTSTISDVVSGFNE
ncbi:MAG TPA: STAS domain-containing protein, partial [Puia sp.]|nr:STAS domain-containing protein [Puia sp.]